MPEGRRKWGAFSVAGWRNCNLVDRPIADSAISIDNQPMSRWLVCMTLLTLQGTPGQPASPRPNDDRDVIAAVFAHTVQPEADQYRRDPRPLKVLAQTLGSCTVRTNWTCLPVERLEILRSAKRPPAIGYTDSVGLEPGELMPDEAVRLELIASVTERNRTRQTLAMNASPAVTLVPESDEAELLRDRDLTR
jgi:hypothetical protein